MKSEKNGKSFNLGDVAKRAFKKRERIQNMKNTKSSKWKDTSERDEAVAIETGCRVRKRRNGPMIKIRKKR